MIFLEKKILFESNINYLIKYTFFNELSQLNWFIVMRLMVVWKYAWLNFKIE
jgi:hypothetical protein